MIKVSVIVPIYNMEPYLKQCLDSLVQQTMEEKEIICINDGSTDHSREILIRYSNRFKCIRVIDRDNHGVGASRNHGIDIANGEFVAFVDPDDWYPEEDILDTLYRNAKDERVLICGGSFSSYYKGNIKTVYDTGYTFTEDKKLKYREYQWDYGYHRFIYQTEMLRTNHIYFPDYRRYQDPPFFVKAMLTAGEFYGIQKITYRYRIGHQTIDWTMEKTRDLLKGLIDNLMVSREHNLSQLHYNTVKRLSKDFVSPISKHLLNHEKEVIDLMLRVRECIAEDLLQKENSYDRESYPNELFALLQSVME